MFSDEDPNHQDKHALARKIVKVIQGDLATSPQ